MFIWLPMLVSFEACFQNKSWTRKKACHLKHVYILLMITILKMTLKSMFSYFPELYKILSLNNNIGLWDNVKTC